MLKFRATFISMLLAGLIFLNAPATFAATASAPRAYELAVSTYFGGSGGDLLRDMTVDSEGNIYIAGIAGSDDFPRTAGNVAGETKTKGAMVDLPAPLGPPMTITWGCDMAS